MVQNPKRAASAVVAGLLALASCGPAAKRAAGVPPFPTAAHGAPTARSVETAPPPVAKPEPAPEPASLFADRASVRYDELVREVRRVADELVTTPEVELGYRALLADYELEPSDVSIESYSRVRLVFEATRDGGLWGLRWAITDRMPWSDAVWEQWRDLDVQRDPETTAVAECDELSALFALVARDVGVEGFVGLLWPAWNHTVAVWQLRRGATEKDPGTVVRIVVPTSQVWLSRQATLGTREFKANRAVFPYARRDMKPEAELPAALARFLVARLERYGALSSVELLERRNELGGS